MGLHHLLGLPDVVFFSLDWVCFSICCLGFMLGFGQWACSVKKKNWAFFFFLKVDK